MVGIKPIIICPKCNGVIEKILWVDEGSNMDDEDRILQYPEYVCDKCGYENLDTFTKKELEEILENAK